MIVLTRPAQTDSRLVRKLPHAQHRNGAKITRKSLPDGDREWTGLGDTPPPPILPTEVNAAIKRLKRNKAPGNDNITADVLKDGGEPIIQMFTNMFNRCLSEGKLPSSWKNASVILIHKKGDTADIKNYRPISLLPITYKVFSQVILRRMLRTLDQHQPREQAGFRSGFSTIDHIQVISQLQEKADEHKIPLCFAFVDYEKAFDSSL